MWICTNKSFLSVVAHRDDVTKLLVRSRAPGHIESLFPKAEVFTDEKADYYWRAFIDRAEVSRVIAEQVFLVDYPNFKNSVKDRPYHDMLLDMWHTLYDYQRSFFWSK